MNDVYDIILYVYMNTSESLDSQNYEMQLNWLSDHDAGKLAIASEWATISI